MAKALNVSLAVTADTSQAKAQLQQLQTTLQQLTANSANLKLGINPSEIQQASLAATQLAAHLKQATDATTGTLNFTKFESSIRHSGQTIESYGQQLLNLGPKGQQAFNQLAQAVAQSEIPMKRMSNVLGQFGTVIANTIRWQASSSLIHGFMGSIQTAYRYAQDLNQSLNNIQIVTQMSDTQMSKFAESANKAAKSLSTTTTSYTDAALIYYQQGIRDQNEINERTNATIKMANVTGQSAQQVSNQMTAIWNNFAKGGDNLEYYADVITALGAATASSSEEISKGLEKFAATADTVGLSYENATAALATITATTRQSADSVGTGLRTLFARLDSLKLGETLEDGVDLTKYTKALQSVGVQVLDTNGNLKRMDDILDDLGERWGDISDTQKVALAQTVGGVRQYTTLMALMNNFDFYKENVEIAKNSEGTLQKQQDIYEKSWAASAKRVRASLETIYSTLIDDQFFIKFNNGFTKVLDTINNIIKGLGGMSGILGTLSGSLMQTFSPQITSGLYKFGVGVADFFTLGRYGASQRANTITNLSQMMAGGVYDSQTKKVDMSMVSKSQASSVTDYQNLLNYQMALSSNANYMTPEMLDAARRASDQYNQSISAYQTAQAQLGQARNEHSDIAVKMRQDAYEQYSKNRQFLIDNSRNPELLASRLPETNRVAVQAAMNRFETEYGSRLQRVEGLKALQRGEYAASDQGNQQLSKDIGAFYYQQLEEGVTSGKQNISDVLAMAQDDLNKWVQGEGSAELARLGIKTDSEDFQKKYLDSVGNVKSKELQEEMAKRQKEQDKKNAEELSKQKSLGMQIASGITNFAGGTLSALSAAKQIDVLTDSIQRLKDGSLDMGEGLTQAFTAGVTGLMNFGRSMTQFTTMFGGNALAGGVFAVLMTALPQIIKQIDKLNTTPLERMAEISTSTEAASAAAENAKSAYEALLNGFASHSSLLDALDELTQGTIEFEAALLKANSAAYDLINTYGLVMGEDWSFDERGAITFTEEGQKRIQQQKFEEMQQAEAQKRSMEAYQARSQANTNASQFQSEVLTQGNKIIGSIASSAKKTLGYDPTEILTLAQKQLYGGGLTDEEAAAYKAFFAPGQGHNRAEIDSLIAQYQQRLSSGTLKKSNYLGSFSVDQALQYLSEGTLADNFAIASGAPAKELIAATTQLQGIRGTSALSDFDQMLAQQIAQSNEFKNIGDKKNATISSDYYTSNWINTSRNVLGAGGGEMAYMSDGAGGVISVYVPSATPSDEDIRTELGDIDLFDEALAQKVDVAQLYRDQMKSLLGWDDDKISETISEIQKTATENGEDPQQMMIEAVRSAWTNSQYEDATKQLDEAAQQVLDEHPEIRKGFENFNKLTFDEMAKLQDTALATGNEQLKGVANTYRARWEKSATDLGIAAFEGVSDNIDGSALMEAVQKITNTYDPETFKQLTQLQDNMVSIMGDAGNDKFAETLIQMGKGNNQLRDFYESLDYSQGVNNVLKQIKTMKQGAGNKQLAEFYQKQWDTIYEANGGVAGEFQRLYENVFSDDKLMKKFSDTFKKTGKISAESIYEVAHESEEVADALERAGVNAEGFANALEAIMDTDLNLNIGDISNALLKAMSTAGSVKSQLAEVFEYIDSYEKERSAGDIGDFYAGLVKDVRDEANRGLFGDGLFKQSFEALFGETGLKDLSDWLTKTQGMNSEERKEAWNNDKEMSRYQQVMKQVEEDGNLGALYDYYFNSNKQKKLAGKEQTWKDAQGNEHTFTRGKNGKFSVDGHENIFGYDENGFHVYGGKGDEFFEQFQTQEDFNQFLQSAFGVDENTAKAMTSDLASQNEGMNQRWQKGSAQKAYTDLMKDLTDNGELMSSKEIDAFLKDYGKHLDSEQKKALQDKGYGLKEDYDHTNTDFETLQESFNQNAASRQSDLQFNDYLRAMGAGKEYTGFELGANGEHISQYATDLDNLTSAFERLGMSSTEANDMIDQNFNSGNGAFGELAFQARDASGAMLDLNTNSEEFTQWLSKQENSQGSGLDAFGGSITDAIAAYQQQMEQTFQSQGLATAISDALGNVELKLTADTTEADTTLAKYKEQDGTITYEGKFPTNEDVPTLEGTVNYTGNFPKEPEAHPAAGMNNTKGFAGGYHINNDFQGIAETGELGPELWVHDGQPALTGVHGRNKIFVSKGDQIFTASQTREILRKNPDLQNIPGFPDGEGNSQQPDPGNGRSTSTMSNASSDDDYGAYGRKKKKKGGKGGGGGDEESDNYKPERYHVISRQLAVLQRQYERLEKAKENAYGTNILDAIDDEIAAQDKLIKKQRDYIKEIESYRKKDLKELDELGVKYKLDENGNIANWDALQKKYEKDAQNGDEKAKKIWEAIQQYEETIDKLEEEKDKLQDQIREKAKLQLEKITTQAELKIKFDDKQIALIQHQIDKLDDDIYSSAKVLALVGDNLDRINDKIATSRTAINNIFKDMKDKNGNAINITMEQFLAMSAAQRDALDINGDFGLALEEQLENILDYIKELEEFKTKGVEELSEAFDELSENVDDAIGNFSYYTGILTTMRDIIDLQNIKFPKALRESVNDVQQALMNTSKNNIKAYQDYYMTLEEQANNLRSYIETVTDTQLKKQYQEQLDQLEDAMDECMSEVADLWQATLSQAQEDFERNLDWIIEDYATAIAGIYGDLDTLSGAYERTQKANERYAEDYEKFYQLSKLQRTINKDLDKAALNGYKHNKNMRDLLEEIEQLQASGAELSAYDLELLQKRYEYYKALADLEDAQDAKSQVRLQRDRNGNWGYVYTANEENIEDMQQAADDKLYELQKFIRESSNDLEQQILDLQQTYAEERAELIRNGAAPEVLQEFDDYYNDQLSYLQGEYQKTLDDAGKTVDAANKRYNKDNFDIVDQFEETAMASISAATSTAELINNVKDAMGEAANAMTAILADYQGVIDGLNELVAGDGDFATNIRGFIASVDRAQEINLGITQEAITEFGNVYDEVLTAAEAFDEKFRQIYEPIIKRNEEFVQALTDALKTMNRLQINNNNGNKASGQNNANINKVGGLPTFDTGGYTGDWGSNEGKLAILHQKEQIFNQEDTARILVASKILQTIDLQAKSASGMFSNIFSPKVKDNNQVIEQSVHIEASFPNAVNHAEIEEAFNNLSNKAIQYANRKNK